MKKIAISLVTMFSSFTSNSLKTLFESDINDKTKYEAKIFVFINSIDDIIKKERVIKEINKLKKSYNFNFELIFSNHNEGITIPRIKIMDAILKTDAEYFLEIHDDMIFTNDFFTNMINVFEIDSKYKIVMPSLIEVKDLKTESSEDIKDRGRQGAILTESCVQSHPWLIDMKLIKEIGYFDKDFSPSAGEDDDLYKRIYDAGYVPVHTSMSLVGHKQGFTRNATGLGYCDYNRLFEAKHHMTVRDFQINIVDQKRKEINY